MCELVANIHFDRKQIGNDISTYITSARSVFFLFVVRGRTTDRLNMSNSHLFMKSGFPRAPLQNGLGRYVGQLQRITIKYCKTMGCSKGVRYVNTHMT